MTQILAKGDLGIPQVQSSKGGATMAESRLDRAQSKVVTIPTEPVDLTKVHQADQPWWEAAQRIATLIIVDGVPSDQDQILRRDLRDNGFKNEDIEAALNWVGSASLSGQLTNTLSMMVEETISVRIDHPLECLVIPDDLRRSVRICFLKGLISREFFEKILESLRNIDARDWGHYEIVTYLHDAMSPSLPWISRAKLDRLLSGESTESNNAIFN